MLQATGGSSYFAFEPFLKALQRSQTLPLADHITQLTAGTVEAGEPARLLNRISCFCSFFICNPAERTARDYAHSSCQAYRRFSLNT